MMETSNGAAASGMEEAVDMPANGIPHNASDIQEEKMFEPKARDSETNIVHSTEGDPPAEKSDSTEERHVKDNGPLQEESMTIEASSRDKDELQIDEPKASHSENNVSTTDDAWADEDADIEEGNASDESQAESIVTNDASPRDSGELNYEDPEASDPEKNVTMMADTFGAADDDTDVEDGNFEEDNLMEAKSVVMEASPQKTGDSEDSVKMTDELDVPPNDDNDIEGTVGILVWEESVPPATTGGIRYRDHYSLTHPSSTVRFRSSATSHRVYQGIMSQFVLEEKNNQITVKQTSDTTGGVMFLRAVYTTVCVLWYGFLFVFCTQLLIFLIMNLSVYCGRTTGSSVDVRQAVGTILSLPLYVYGLASALIIAGHFISDTWAGQYLMKTLVFAGMGSVITAWTSFGFFLGFPLIVMGICLCANLVDWWSITAIFWFSCVSLFYVLFAAVVIFFEIKACVEIVSNGYGIKNDIPALLKQCVLLRQSRTYSGTTSQIYLTRGKLSYSNNFGNPINEKSISHRYSLYSRLTEWSFLQRIGMFKRLEAPGKRCYPVEESQGVRPFVTYNTWSLEKLYCKPRHSWFVAVITGPDALSRAQMQSSFACAVLGNLLTWFLVVAFLVWFDSTALVIGLVILVLVLFSIPTFRVTLSIYNMTKDLVGIKRNDAEEPFNQQEIYRPETPDETNDAHSSGSSEFGLSVTGESSTGVFQVIETYRITQASDRFCWIMFAAEIGLLFLWPLVALYVTNDTAIGTVFVFIGLFSLLRYYLNAAVVLEEVGNMHYLKGNDSLAKWKNQSRTDDIVKNITRSRTRGPWILVLAFFVVVTLLLVIGGLSQDDPQQGDEGYNMTFIPNFRYERDANSLPYPTCSLDFATEQGPVATRDFAFLSIMAYEANTTKVQEELDGWFGGNVAIDTPDTVSDFRNQTNRELSPVTYKLFSFPNLTSNGAPIGVVSVRGSQNAWDWLTNAQLWSAAYGMQILRSFLPFGFIWDPIYDELIKAISIIESESIKRVSYYRETSDFVHWLQDSGTYADVKITGHSLGGGLSIITAAQTQVSGVAFSGPNAMMLRKSLHPPITEAALDTYTFNVIPDRDLVPTAGGKAKLYQNIDCKAAPNAPSDCHDILRTLCEILTTCGTGNRPALCQCVTQFGYPEPISSNGETFADICGL